MTYYNMSLTLGDMSSYVKGLLTQSSLSIISAIIFLRKRVSDSVWEGLPSHQWKPMLVISSYSNLAYLCCHQKVVASRIQSRLLSNSLSSSFQSAYRMFHSTETTLLGIHNDLILAMDRDEVTSLILLDLSAALDTVDHSILLHRLQHWFGLHSTSLDWFSSYLTSRSQEVSIQNSASSFSNRSCGVPQGSVLGPLLFTRYTTPLGSVISKNSIKYHLYADDT